MALVYSGNSRSLTVTVTKYVNGVPQTPVTYPTALDIANGYFTYSAGQVDIPTANELAQMSSSEYAAILIALQTYAQEQNPGLNFATATVTVGAVIVNDPNCPEPGTPVTTTTTTVVPVTTTTTAVPTTTTTTGVPLMFVYDYDAPELEIIDDSSIDITGKPFFLFYVRNDGDATLDVTAVNLGGGLDWSSNVGALVDEPILPGNEAAGRIYYNGTASDTCTVQILSNDSANPSLDFEVFVTVPTTTIL